MAGWFVTPETERLTVDGQWFEVKKRLNEGERRAMLASTFRTLPNGAVATDLEMVGGKSEVLAYLLDWSLTDPSGRVVSIATDAKKKSAIDALAPEKFEALSAAVKAHIEAMAKADDAKKQMDGEDKSAATSPSAA